MDSNKRVNTPRWAKVSLALGLVFLLISVGLTSGLYALSQRYENNVNRADLLGKNRKDGRDIGKVTGPLNVLVIGSDSRAKENYDPNDPSSTEAAVPGERADLIMIAHIPRKMNRGYVVSIPRDTYVDIPPLDGQSEGGMDKINAAFAWGGAPLMVKTVEELSGITINHVVIVDFSSVRTITDAIGGVDVNVDQEVIDPRSNRTFKEGKNHLDGTAAEDYVRQRYELPDGDFDRIKRQQQYLRALLTKIHKTNWLTNPGKFDKLMMTVTRALTVDEDMPIREFAFALRRVNASDVAFVTLPTVDSPIVDGSGAINPEEQSSELFAALEADAMGQYVKAHPGNDVTRGA